MWRGFDKDGNIVWKGTSKGVSFGASSPTGSTTKTKLISPKKGSTETKGENNN